MYRVKQQNYFIYETDYRRPLFAPQYFLMQTNSALTGPTWPHRKLRLEYLTLKLAVLTEPLHRRAVCFNTEKHAETLRTRLASFN